MSDTVTNHLRRHLLASLGCDQHAGRGRMGAPGKPCYDRIADMLRRLQAYRTDRNAEHLVDVRNLCELEFVEGSHRGIIPSDDAEHTPRAATD